VVPHETGRELSGPVAHQATDHPGGQNLVGTQMGPTGVFTAAPTSPPGATQSGRCSCTPWRVLVCHAHSLWLPRKLAVNCLHCVDPVHCPATKAKEPTER